MVAATKTVFVILIVLLTLGKYHHSSYIVLQNVVVWTKVSRFCKSLFQIRSLERFAISLEFPVAVSMMAHVYFF